MVAGFGDPALQRSVGEPIDFAQGGRRPYKKRRRTTAHREMSTPRGAAPQGQLREADTPRRFVPPLFIEGSFEQYCRLLFQDAARRRELLKKPNQTLKARLGF